MTSCPSAFVALKTNVSLTLIRNVSSDETIYAAFRQAAYQILIPVILSIGLLGNVVNLAVFSFRVSRDCMDRLELSATAGLISIALSDLLFCLVGIPAAFTSPDSHFMPTDGSTTAAIGFYYNIYKGALVNLFLLTSTWLIVVISVERYLVVCHPLRARWIIRIHKTLIAQGLVVVVSVLVCLPVFLQYSIKSMPCFSGCTCYYAIPYKFVWHTTFRVCYKVIWLMGGTLVPLGMLTFCNGRLIVDLYRSKMLGIADPDRYCTPRISALVVAIICSYTVLVAPSSILDVVVWAVTDTADGDALYRLRTAVVVCNLLQALKFASNFVLYCSINTKFRLSLGLALKRMSASGFSRVSLKGRFDLAETTLYLNTIHLNSNSSQTQNEGRATVV